MSLMPFRAKSSYGWSRPTISFSCPPVPSLSLESNQTFTHLSTKIPIILTKDFLMQNLPVNARSLCYSMRSMTRLTSLLFWDTTLLALILCWFQSSGRPLRTEYLRLCFHHSLSTSAVDFHLHNGSSQMSPAHSTTLNPKAQVDLPTRSPHSDV